MGLICSCDAVLPSLLDVTCPQDLDQIVKIAFQLDQGGTPAFTTGATTSIDVVDAWTTLLASSTSTKMVLSPAIANTVIPASEGNFVGEDSNESVNGLGYYLGENNIKVSGEIHSAPQAVITAMRELSCYSDASLGGSKLTAYFFLRRIGGVSRVFAKAGESAGDYSGFSIYNFRISSLGNDGYNSKTKYMWSFTMQPDEFDSGDVVTLGFNPLALANV